MSQKAVGFKVSDSARQERKVAHSRLRIDVMADGRKEMWDRKGNRGIEEERNRGRKICWWLMVQIKVRPDEGGGRYEGRGREER